MAGVEAGRDRGPHSIVLPTGIGPSLSSVARHIRVTQIAQALALNPLCAVPLLTSRRRGDGSQIVAGVASQRKHRLGVPLMHERNFSNTTFMSEIGAAEFSGAKVST